MFDALDPDRVVVRNLLEGAARRAPDEPFVVFEDGTSWTRRQALHAAYAAACSLRGSGVMEGSVVAAALPNGEGYLRTWWGAAMLGAPVVPVNIAHRGPLLSHLLAKAKPTTVVAAPEFIPHLRDSLADTGQSPRVLGPADVTGYSADAPALDRPIQPWDPISLALTSGSTGPSKVVRVSYAHSANSGQVNFSLFAIGAADTYLADLPMVHVSALYFLHAAIVNNTSISVRSRPALRDYWEVARDTGATVSQLYSTMISFLEVQPPRDAERRHKLRVVVTVPLPADPRGFATRFGIRNLAIGYGSTEASCAIAADPRDPLPPASTGRLLPGWDARLVDEHDMEVPPGEAGELIIRSSRPWLITTEYVDDPAATAAAWRNGWFHTGDLLRRDANGTFYFVDRARDAIRRRGQNISSFEVEAVVRAYPGITDAAVVADRTDVAAEDEVKAWITVEPGTRLVFADLLRFCTDRLPYYMVPRYFEIIDEFPRTASAKIRKSELRERGSSAATWDRIANGVDVRRTGLVAVPGLSGRA
jgi:crotonobetaine/carnitine-CoA ligase